MFFKTTVAILVLIMRTYLVVKVSSWVILNLFFSKTLPITDIETYLVVILLDIWLLGNSVEINVINKSED